MSAEPFEDSRRLTGCNLYFDATGAALETARGLVFDDETLVRWRTNIVVARDALGWPDGEVVVRRHRSGASLAFAAPFDQLYAATEVNEWAWWSALLPPLEGEGFNALHAPGHAAVWDTASALRTLIALATAEGRPALVALRAEAETVEMPFLFDDDAVSIGAGEGARVWPIDNLPAPDAVDWGILHAIPTALVTGSNGKTTTVRLIAAMTRAHGWLTAHSCTDGVYFDGEALESGDFSGPGGARTALRHRQAQAAILETARGGILRRGLALCRADAAVVTNIAADHFGEYGIHGLDDLAEVKLTVAHAVGSDGLLVLNADDALLRRHAETLTCPIGWFADDHDAPALVAHRAAGGATCATQNERLRLHRDGTTHDLGAVDAMPLTLRGRARYNVANIAAAALAANALGVPPATIATTLARFGAAHADNPGRLQHWRFGATDVYVDYAHNPDGLHGLMRAIDADARRGRLAVLLGHAGNREDDDLRAVATTVAGYRPERVILKDIAGYERGRQPGEIAAIMRGALNDAGIADERIETHLDEVEAARLLLQDMRDDDLVILPIHEIDARDAIVAELERMRARGWRPGDTLPDGAEA